MLDAVAKKGCFNLTSEQISAFEKYKKLLLEYNEKFNLTAITDPDEVDLKHFVDCMYCLESIPQGATAADVGSGAGFPGMVVAIMRPDVSITLMDALNKRVGFLTTVANELGLDNVKCIHIRAEDAAKPDAMREKFDVVLSRAVANMSSLSEYCMPLVKKGGVMIAMKGRKNEEELEGAKPLLKLLGGRTKEVKQYSLPDTDISDHCIVIVEKVESTPNKYPRKGKKIGTV
ncbi:MAG: 16S rRNA (guanine(527)-N(7))-methyltransferase RsmG [Eubacteriales bacterium]|nr:16S rRNA (guanine(527)-N(7))-methyltransferase RsmG [Eubacteriales bacterium]